MTGISLNNHFYLHTAIKAPFFPWTLLLQDYTVSLPGTNRNTNKNHYNQWFCLHCMHAMMSHSEWCSKQFFVTNRLQCCRFFSDGLLTAVIGFLINESVSGTWDNISLTHAVIFNQINGLTEKKIQLKRTICSQIWYYCFSHKYICQTNANIFSELWLRYMSVLHTKQ